MAYLPPVNLPDLSQPKDYAGQLYGMLSNTGQAFYQNRRDKVGDAQWQQEQERLSTAQALAQSNADRNYAQQVDSDKWSREQWQTEYDRAVLTGDRNYALELQKFKADQAAGAGEGEWYGTPQWFQGADGTMGFGVLSKSGEFREMAPPEGTEWAPAVTFQDTGTARVPMYSRGGGQAGEPLQVDVAGEKRQQEIGGAGGKAAAALPMIEYQTEILLGSIDGVLQDPNLSSLTGPGGGRLPTWLSTDPGGMSATQAKINQVVQKSFLQAYDALRGAGAITEAEGQAAKAAWSRLVSQEMSDEDYLVALQDYRREAAKMLEVARQKATGGASSPVDQSPVYTSPGGFQIFEDQ